MFIGVLFSVLIGTVVGSFLNVVALRTLDGRSIIRPPSHCPYCGARLSAKELVPIVSFVIQKGRCRACGARISLLYPFGEALTGAAFAWLFVLWADGRLSIVEALSLAVFATLLIIVTIADLRSMRIPNPVLLFYAPVLFGLKLIIAPAGSGWWTAIGEMGTGTFMTILLSILGSGLLFGGVFWLIHAVSRGGMGFGDVKYAAVLGLYLGSGALLPLILIASLSGLMAAVILMTAGRKTRKDAIPFGPYLSLAAWVIALYGDELYSWYFSLW